VVTINIKKRIAAFLLTVPAFVSATPVYVKRTIFDLQALQHKKRVEIHLVVFKQPNHCARLEIKMQSL
jgi:hypothetical protein